MNQIVCAIFDDADGKVGVEVTMGTTSFDMGPFDNKEDAETAIRLLPKILKEKLKALGVESDEIHVFDTRINK